MRMLLRADSNRDIGTGHIFRCLHVAKYFSQRGWDIYFLVNDDPFTKNMTREYLFETVSTVRIDQEIIETKRFLENKAYDVILVDLFDKHMNQELMEIFFGNAGRVLVAVTDEYNRVKTKSHVVIASHPKQVEYDYTDHEQTVFAGEQYFIVSEEFKENKIAIKKHVTDVLISFGGHDPDNVMGKVTDYLIRMGRDDDISGLTFNYLIGGIYKYETELKRVLGTETMSYRFHKGLPSLVPLLLRCDVAISGGGNTLYELCNMGIPSLVVTQNDRQDEACKLLHQKMLVNHIGFHTDITFESFRESFLTMLRSYESRMKYHKKCLSHFEINVLERLDNFLAGDENEIKADRN